MNCLNALHRATLAPALASGLALCVMLQSCAQPITVVDGETLREGKELIRIAGLDAPDIERAKCDTERELGRRAKARLEQLMATGPVVIERLPDKDAAGRTLARVLVAGRDAGQILIGEGLAAPWKGGPISLSWCGA